MDFTILKTILLEELKDLKPNKYKESNQSTLELAISYVKGIDGCDASKISKKKIEMFYNESLFASISGQRASTSTEKGLKISNDKFETEKYLSSKNIKTTASTIFKIDEYDRAKRYIEGQDKLMAVKPTNLNAGRGITLNVDIENLNFAWSVAKKAYRNMKLEKNLMIQPMANGIESRFLVIEGKFNSAILRVPANIIGDGKHTIKELIDQKNKERLANPHLKNLPIKLNDTLKYNLDKMGFQYNDIVDSDRVLFLHNSSNISLGGDSYEISHLVSNRLKKLAEDAVEAIPGLNTGGVDILYSEFDDKNATVLEVTPNANLRMHHYPWKGKPKKSIFDLIDQLLADYKKSIQ